MYLISASYLALLLGIIAVVYPRNTASPSCDCCPAAPGKTESLQKATATKILISHLLLSFLMNSHCFSDGKITTKAPQQLCCEAHIYTLQC